MNAENKNIWRWLGLLIFLYILFRLPVILSYSETIDRELYRGTLAKEFMAGLQLPWHYLTTDDYSLGAPFNALLTIPFFSLFGETFFALKLLPFFWHLLSLIIWFFVLHSFFSHRETFFILLLFILAPVQAVRFFTANHGTHFEMLLWTGLSLFILKEFFSKKIPILQGAALLGLIGGFSSSLILTNWVTVFVILVYLGFALKKERAKFIFIYGLFFLLGFCPGLIHNIRYSWQGIDLIRQFYFYKITLYHLWIGFRSVFFTPDFSLNGLLGFGFESIYLFCLIHLSFRKWGFWKNLSGRLDIEVFSLLYQLSLLFFIWVSNYSWGMQYFFPLYPFMAITIISTLQSFRPVIRFALIGFCLLIGLADNLSMIHWKRMGETLHLRGYSYQELGDIFRDHLERDHNLTWLIDKVIKHKEPAVQKAIYQGMGDFFVFNNEKDIYAVSSMIQDRIDKEFQPVFFKRLGIQLGIFCKFDPQKVKGWAHALPVSQEDRFDIYFGVMHSLIGSEMDPVKKTERSLTYCKEAPAEMRPACYEVFGTVLGFQRPVVSQIDPPYLDFYYLGLGRFFAIFEAENPGEKLEIDFPLTAAQKTLFFQGYVQEIDVREEDPWRRSRRIEAMKSSIRF